MDSENHYIHSSSGRRAFPVWTPVSSGSSITTTSGISNKPVEQKQKKVHSYLGWGTSASQAYHMTHNVARSRCKDGSAQRLMPVKKGTPRIASAIIYVLLFLVVRPAWGQNNCDRLTQNAYEIIQFTADYTQDEVDALIGSARVALKCYGDRKTPRTAWLQRNIIWAYVKGGNPEAAKREIDVFLNEYYKHAGDMGRAGFWMDNYLFHTYRDELIQAQQAWSMGYPYIEALPRHAQALYLLNGFHLAHWMKNYEEAIIMADSARGRLPNAPTEMTRDERYALARILQSRSEALLDAGQSLERAKRDLNAAITLYEENGGREHISTTLTLLGRVERALGSPEGIDTIRRAMQLAAGEGFIRGEIYAAYRLGLVQLEQKGYAEAEQLSRQGIARSDSIGSKEFRSGLFTLLGDALLEQGRLAEARSAYQEVVATAQDPEQVGMARAGLLRVAQAEGERWKYLLGAFALATLILGYIGGYMYALRHRMPVTVIHGAEQESTPQDLLFARRQKTLHQILVRPETLAQEWLDPQDWTFIEEGLPSAAMLFTMVAKIEYRQGETNREIEYRSMHRYLTEQFRKREWDWPRTISDWHYHFEAHPTEAFNYTIT